MSRSYAIRLPLDILLSEDTRNRLGSYSIGFEILEILPPQQMREILRQKLLALGFTEEANGLAMPCSGERSAVLNLETLQMDLKVPLPDGMSIIIEEEAQQQWDEAIRNAMDKNRQINSLGSLARSTIGRQAAEDLTNLALQAKAKVSQALKDTYRDAVKEKASKLGSVNNVSESNDGATWRIRIEISD